MRTSVDRTVAAPTTYLKAPTRGPKGPAATGAGERTLKEWASTATPRDIGEGHGPRDQLGPRARRARGIRRFVGGFYLTMGGINAGIVFADPQTYQHFADTAYLDFVTQQWNDVVMANPSFWGLLLAAGEIVLGALLLHGGPAARVGWVGAAGLPRPPDAVRSRHLAVVHPGPGRPGSCGPRGLAAARGRAADGSAA